MNVCFSLEINVPTDTQIKTILNRTIDIKNYNINELVTFINKDLRKLHLILDTAKDTTISYEILNILFSKSVATDDMRNIVEMLLNKKHNMEEHSIINETDRTIIGLLWHENVIDILDKVTPETMELYINILENICFADYIDRITFQKQIWEFNEMSSLLKTIYNNNLLYSSNIKKKQINDVRFTKVLTKYSTEYNNMLFIQNLCQQLSMDKKDVFSYFLSLRQKYSDDEIYELFDNENYQINKLDINRVYRYLDSYTKSDD